MKLNLKKFSQKNEAFISEKDQLCTKVIVSHLTHNSKDNTGCPAALSGLHRYRKWMNSDHPGLIAVHCDGICATFYSFSPGTLLWLTGTVSSIFINAVWWRKSCGIVRSFAVTLFYCVSRSTRLPLASHIQKLLLIGFWPAVTRGEICEEEDHSCNHIYLF